MEEHIGAKVMGLGLREDFMNSTPKARKLKEKNK